MSTARLHSDTVAFFDEFTAVFPTFDGAQIALRYAAPYLAIHADGSSDLFPTTESIASYFQRIVDGYRNSGCHSCWYRHLEIVPMGGTAVLGTVTWELLRSDGSVLAVWRESYNLAYLSGRLKAFVSVDHSDSSC